MAAAPVERDPKRVGGGERGPHAHPDRAGRKRSDVLADHNVGSTEAVEEPVVDHGAGAGTLLLRRLEHRKNASAPARIGDECAERADQGGDAHVVTARVHDRHLVPLGVDTGRRAGVGQPGLLAHGEGIHVGAHQHGRPVAALEHAHNTRAPDALGDDEAELAQAVGDEAGGARFGEPQLGVLVLVAAVGVAMAGYLIGPLGMPAVVAGLVVVGIVQARFRLGDVSGMSRAPVNFMAFAALSETGAALWQVLLGSVIGAAFILLLARVLPQRAHEPEPSTRRARVEYGITLIVGAIALVVGAELLDFPYVTWALLSFCMVLSVGANRRARRTLERIVGTLIGAVAATLVALAPAPVPIIAAVIATVLCVAYLRQGNYTLFVAFLTPSVLLTAGADASAVALGVGRIEAVMAAGLLALALTTAVAAAGAAVDRRAARRAGSAEDDAAAPPDRAR